MFPCQSVSSSCFWGLGSAAEVSVTLLIFQLDTFTRLLSTGNRAARERSLFEVIARSRSNRFDRPPHSFISRSTDPIPSTSDRRMLRRSAVYGGDGRVRENKRVMGRVRRESERERAFRESRGVPSFPKVCAVWRFLVGDGTEKTRAWLSCGKIRPLQLDARREYFRESSSSRKACVCLCVYLARGEQVRASPPPALPRPSCFPPLLHEEVVDVLSREGRELFNSFVFAISPAHYVFSSTASFVSDYRASNIRHGFDQSIFTPLFIFFTTITSIMQFGRSRDHGKKSSRKKR